MKYSKLILSAFLFFTATQAFSQISIGIKTAYVKAWEEYGEVGLPNDANIHFYSVKVSALIYKSISKFMEIGIEPGYVQRGAACEPGFIIFNQDTKLTLNYLELPIIAKFNVRSKNQKFGLYSKIGGSASMAISAYRDVMEIPDLQPFSRTRLDLNDNDALSKWDYGLYGGLGIEVGFGPGRFLMEGSYYYGIPNVDSFNRSQNRSIEISVGYLISF